MNNLLKKVGLSARFETEATMFDDFVLGRILSQAKHIYRVMTHAGEIKAEVSGKFRYNVENVTEFPTVGDFVMLDRADDATGHAMIHHVLSRKSVFIRKAAGTSHESQVVAANVDIVYICMAANNDFNLRRLERYLGIAWDSGAKPVIILTKADLSPDLATQLVELEEVALGVDLLVTSFDDRTALEAIKDQLSTGQTAVFIGSSGVGKSTLINHLLGQEALETGGLRNDDKGRHTTTHRELFALPSGGVVIDTPGMRELGLESANLTQTFTDIDELAHQCKFNDCQHTTEPKCAVKAAIESGELSQERYDSYLKLSKEAQYEGLTSREIEYVKLNNIYANIGGMKRARDHFKKKR